MTTEQFAAANTAIAIAPDFGCNVFEWTVDNKPLLYAPPGFPDPKQRPFAGGNPVLFPSVGRTWNRNVTPAVPEQYTIAGDDRTYTMPSHGFPANGQWHKLNEEQAVDRHAVTYRFAADADTATHHYPFSLAASLTYELSENTLTTTAVFENLGETPAPFAYGLHPYFRIQNRAAVTLEIPCATQQVLDPDMLIPVGTEPRASAPITLADDQDYDMVFADSTGDTASLIDRDAGYAIDICCDRAITTYVIYAPAGREFVCLEPWTRGLGQFEDLATEGWEKRQKLAIVPGGATRQVRIQYRLRAL